MFIKDNPKDETYRDLIDFAFEVCNEFVLVIRKDIDTSDNIKYTLEKLQCSLKDIKEQFEWPGTMLFGDKPASVFYYNTDMNAKEVLKQAANSLHDWVQPNLPEDLSFIKNNKPWLINISHEYESYIETEEKEEIDRIIKIKGLKVRL